MTTKKTRLHILSLEPLFCVSSFAVDESDDNNDDKEDGPHHCCDDDVEDPRGQTVVRVPSPLPLTVATVCIQNESES